MTPPAKRGLFEPGSESWLNCGPEWFDSITHRGGVQYLVSQQFIRNNVSFGLVTKGPSEECCLPLSRISSAVPEIGVCQLRNPGATVVLVRRSFP